MLCRPFEILYMWNMVIYGVARKPLPMPRSVAVL